MQSFLQTLPVLFAHSLVQKGNLPITGISTDTRSLKRGDMFIPIVGEHFDAHQFVPQVLDKISAIVLSQDISVPIPRDITVFKVHDTLNFYHLLAKKYLDTKTKLKRIAITGSAGKTSTKEWLSLLLSKQYRTYKTLSNFNNLIGVPRSILEITNEQIAIFELGSGKPGDIKILTDIVQPDISIVTSVGTAHLEFFGNLKNIAIEKASICHSQKCYTTDDIPFHQEVFKNFHHINPRQIFQSIQNQHQAGFLLNLQGNIFSFPFFGEYNLKNLSLAIVVAYDSGITPEQIAHTIFTPLPSYRSKIVQKQKIQLILDCYNANPLSMKESLSSVHQFSPKPILVLGDMLELGEQSEILHKELGLFLNTLEFPMVFFIGEQMRFAHQVYQHPALWAVNIQDISASLLEYIHQSNTFFVKGSRGMHLEDIENL